jgi:catechol 2,3-dioxygenase-like lactoylglutathione lyase family enzyme
MTINHVGLVTPPAKFEAMRAFYLSILAPLGYSIYKEDVPKYCGMGKKNAGPDFWLHCGGDDDRPGKTHVAFDVGSPKAVDEWFKNAM